MIELQICQGTTCYVMGAAQLATLASNLPDDLRGRVRVTGCRCLGHCREGAFGGAPYVTIDGEVLAAATLDSVLAALRARIQGGAPAPFSP
jgi:NADH:ubiquinone oxidoreductase subunit E